MEINKEVYGNMNDISNLNETLDLFKIYNDENVKSQLMKDTLPNIIDTTSNELFIDPHTKSIVNQVEIRTKWLLFNKDNEPIHGHNYPMVRIPKVGYLMKITVPITTDKSKITDFGIDYYVDIRNIEVERMTNLERDNENGNTIIKDFIAIKSFDIARHPELHSILLDRDDFFNKYVKDALE